MKKIFAVMLVALMSASAMFATTKRIYCTMEHGWWTTDSAAIGIHYWGDSVPNTTWPGHRMTLVPGQEYVWYYDLDESVTNVIFARVSASDPLDFWGAQTEDLIVPEDKNHFTITNEIVTWSEEGNKCVGTWSNYGAVPSAIDEVATSENAAKIMENGVLYIQRDGAYYSVHGVRVR